MLIVLIVIAVVLIIGLLILQSAGGVQFPWLSFYVKGKESGFKFHEINLLRRAAVENKLKNPTSLFWSEKTLDRCIRGSILQLRAKGKERDPESTAFISKLFDFRKRVEFNLPKYRLGINSSRNIVSGQYLKIALPGAGLYTTKVVENIRKYLAITYPQGKPLPPGFTWRGQKVKVYFWRRDDAGYYFETKVLGDYSDQKYPILHMTHSDQLVRTQKRTSIRVGLQQNGFLYPLKTIQQANELVESNSGYRCKMVDISESGTGVMVGGKAKAGMPVKVQTQLDSDEVVLCGIVKGVSYKDSKNVSILHIEATQPSDTMKNKILTYVYGIFKDADKKKVGSNA